MIVTSLYSVIVPSSEGTNCVLDGLVGSEQEQGNGDDQNEYLLVIMNGLIRVLNWFGVGFFVGLLQNQIYWMNVTFMTIIMLGAWLNNYIMSQSAMSIDFRITQECWDSVLSFNAIFAVASFGVVALVVIENCTIANNKQRRSREEGVATTATTGEGTSLIS